MTAAMRRVTSSRRPQCLVSASSKRAAAAVSGNGGTKAGSVVNVKDGGKAKGKGAADVLVTAEEDAVRAAARGEGATMPRFKPGASERVPLLSELAVRVSRLTRATAEEVESRSLRDVAMRVVSDVQVHDRPADKPRSRKRWTSGSADGSRRQHSRCAARKQQQKQRPAGERRRCSRRSQRRHCGGSGNDSGRDDLGRGTRRGAGTAACEW